MTASAYGLLAFGLFAAITLGSSLGVVLVRDVWHSVLLLGVALLSVAVHFIILSAEFLAVVQVLVYVGGVLVLISFAVMLTRHDTQPRMRTRPQLRLGGHLARGAAAVGLFVVFAVIIAGTTFGEAAGFPDGGITASIGFALIGLTDLAVQETDNFLVALIVIAVVLDAALDGAIMLAKRDDEPAPVPATEHPRAQEGE